MRIAIFTDSFLPGVGGTEKAVLGLAEALVNNINNEVMVCCPMYTKKIKDSFPFKVLRAKSIRLTKSDYFAFPNLSKKFKLDLDKFKPDIIHCQSISPMTSYAIKYAKKHNLPVIMTIHTKFKTAFSHSIKSKLIVNALIKDMVKKMNDVSKVFTVSNIMKEELKTYGYKGDCEIIKNGLTFEKNEILEYDEKIINEYGLKSSDNILLYVGHIIKYKNLQFILDSLNILKEKTKNFKMVFVGEGPDINYFKNNVKLLKLENFVIFTGVIKDKQKLKTFYHFSKLFLFPSFFDTDGLVVIEAASEKTPTLTLIGTACCERIENEISGFIVDNNINKYADKIYELLLNPSIIETVGQQALKKIPKDWKITAQEYFDVYNELLSQVNNKNEESKNNLAI